VSGSLNLQDVDYIPCLVLVGRGGIQTGQSPRPYVNDKLMLPLFGKQDEIEPKSLDLKVLIQTKTREDFD